MFFQSFPNAAQAVYSILTSLTEHPLQKVVNGMYAEFVGATIQVDNPYATLIASDKRRFNYRYMTAESFWNVSGRADVAFLRRYFNGVDQFVADQPINQRHNARWAYGPALRSQFRAMLDELQDVPDSRRAVATNRVFEAGSQLHGTPPCLVSVQWLFRGGKLTQVTTMRSNDAWLGLPLDLYQFSRWQCAAAAELGCELGPYIHHTGSLHLYEKHFVQARSFLSSNKIMSVNAPRFQRGALPALLRGAPLELVERHGHYQEKETKVRPDYDYATPGMREYAALLIGDYYNCGDAFRALRSEQYGVGW